MREEYSIGANYSRDTARKERGHIACEYIASSRNTPLHRELARTNLRYYLKPAAAIMPSFTALPVGFVAPAGYRPMNPSVARHGGEESSCLVQLRQLPWWIASATIRERRTDPYA